MAEKKKNPVAVVILLLVIAVACLLIIRTATKRPVSEQAYEVPQEEAEYWEKRGTLENNWDGLSAAERTALLEELSQYKMDSVVGPVQDPMQK